MKKKCLLWGGLLLAAMAQAQAPTEWPVVETEARPAARWWWLGSAVDKEGLTHNLEAYAEKGMGTVEITPIYGVIGNEANDIDYLTPQWMDMLKHTTSEAARLGMNVDMNNGTGWPFGGPEVSIEDAATRALFQTYTVQGGQMLDKPITVNDRKQKDVARLGCLMAYGPDGKTLNLTKKVAADGTLNWKAPAGGEWTVIAQFTGKTLQKVKRAAPGGEGYVMDHLDKGAVKRYLAKFDKAFKANGLKQIPNNFFNDSYEVYGADWTPTLLAEFAKRRGYRLEDHFPEFLDESKGAARTDATARIVSDYRETMGELLYENFTRQWTAWAHKHGSQTRNQAHGSPGNLIDLYAAVDVPECEGFGLSNFGIKGLRQDTLTRKNDSDMSMLKYASSGAHLTGKPLVSSETFTWLTDHFRTSLSQCKPDIDLMFLSGVNHTFFHGATYTPKGEAWPGWKFYASVDMTPTNSIWRDAGAFFDYISRCQSFLQMGQPDNDFLVYLPVYDMWNEQPGRMLAFDIHGMHKRAPKFIETVNSIMSAGYDVDYISDNYIRSTRCEGGQLKTVGGAKYKAIIIPAVKRMPADILQKLITLAEQGAEVVFVGNYPESVPGYSNLAKRTAQFDKLLARLPKADFGKVETQALKKGKIITGNDYARTLAATGVVNEMMKSQYGLQYIRRTNADGHHYFISSLQPKGVDAWVDLAVPVKSALFFDPMTGKVGKAEVKGKSVRLQLASGESVILKTFADKDVEATAWAYYTPQTLSLSIDNGWTLSFPESEPAINGTYKIGTLGSWTEVEVDNSLTKINMGTGLYRVEFDLPAMQAAEWQLDLGDVRESARIRINGKEVATLFAVPFRTLVGQYLKPGKNVLEVEVTNLPANRIAEYDRQGIKWRKFKDINVVGINYKKGGYGHWHTVPSGLLGPVKLVPMK